MDDLRCQECGAPARIISEGYDKGEDAESIAVFVECENGHRVLTGRAENIEDAAHE